MKTQSFKDLIVWQKSYKLVLEVYKVTKKFPGDEVYGLSQQMRRAAVSIPSNISEGYGRQHSKEYKQFLSMAYGSFFRAGNSISIVAGFKLHKEKRNG